MVLSNVIQVLFDIVVSVGFLASFYLLVILSRNKDIKNIPNPGYLRSLVTVNILQIITVLPFQLVHFDFQYVPFPVFFCGLMLFFVQYLPTVMVLILIALSVDLYLDVTASLKQIIEEKDKVLVRRQTSKIITCIWISAVLAGSPALFLSNFVTNVYGNKYCGLSWHFEFGMDHKDIDNLGSYLNTLFMLAHYYIPVVITLTIFSFIGWRLKRNIDQSNNNNKMRQQFLEVKNATVVGFFLIMCFTVFYFPYDALAPIRSPTQFLGNALDVYIMVNAVISLGLFCVSKDLRAQLIKYTCYRKSESTTIPTVPTVSVIDIKDGKISNEDKVQDEEMQTDTRNFP